jgi:hypothetical protein
MPRCAGVAFKLYALWRLIVGRVKLNTPTEHTVRDAPEQPLMKRQENIPSCRAVYPNPHVELLGKTLFVVTTKLYKVSTGGYSDRGETSLWTIHLSTPN